MADNTSVSIGFNTKEAQQEIKALSNSMKQTQNEFKIADATLKTTGSSLDRLKNKYQSLSAQMKQQSEITTKCEQGVKKYSQAQEAARQRLEKANAAYEKGKTSLKGNSDELQKLKEEVQKAQKAVTSAENSYTRWNNKLSQSRLEEANLRNELNQTSEAIKKQSSYISQVQAEYSRLQQKTSGIQKGMTATGKALTAGVTAPIVAAAAYSIKSFNAVDDGLDVVMKKTGATDEAAKELKDVYMQVANTIPGEFNDIGAAVGEINTRLEFTGNKLKTASEDFLKFAKVNGSDVNNSVQLVTRAMGDASIPADQYKNVLDSLTVASQKSGISIESMTSNLTKYGAPMRALGLDISDSIALFAAWEKSGVNTEIAFSGMKKAISNWGKEGKDSRVEFQKTMKEIKNAPDIAAATTKAIEIFGSKAGPDLADAIKGGRFEVSAYMDALQSAGGAVDNTYAMIVDGSDDANLAAQKVQVALSGLGEQIMQSAGPAIVSLAEDASELIAKFGELDEGTQKNILKFALFAAALGPVLSIVSKGIKVVNGGIAVFSKLGSLFGNAATAATSAGTATAAAGEAAATGAATAGAAATEAGTAAATAAGTGGIGAFLSALGSVAGVSAGISVVVSAPFAAAAGGAALAMQAIEDYHEELIASGDGALKQAQEFSQKSKEYYDMSAYAKTVEEYCKKYEELKRIQESGTETAAEEKERKEIEQWFIDNYGQYITAEEKKNGIHKETIEYIRNITQAEKERKAAERDVVRNEIAADSKEKRENAQKSLQEIPQLQAERDNMNERITSAQTLKNELEVLNEKYKAIDSTMKGSERVKATEELRKANQKLFDDYEKLVGGGIRFPDLDKNIENVVNKISELEDGAAKKTEWIDGHTKAVEEYKESLNVLQKSITDNIIEESGFESVFELFSSGDYAAQAKAINDIVEECRTLGMTTQETALQVALFKNGFSNLKEAMSSGDKGMKAVVDQMNEYLHTVAGLPENYTIDINAAGDLTLIDTAKEGVEELDNSSAEVKVNVDGKDGEQKVMSLQELIDEFGAAKAVALLQADDQATVTINGVIYRILEYDNATGTAILQADGSEAAITVNTTTGIVRKFGEENPKATLGVDSEPAKSGVESARSFIKNRWQTFTASLKVNADGVGFFAGGTSNAPEGPAVINDEKGVADPRELVKHKGKYYLFEGRDVLVNLSAGDSVYTAAQTKKMLKTLPHYATGANNEAFNSKKDDFEYRQKTSVVTDVEALLWWKEILEEFSGDAEVVKEANIEIYELNKKINSDSIKEYKDRIKEQESASKDWIDYEIKMHNLSVDEQIAAYGRMDENYFNTLNEMIANTTMTAEELDEVWSEYYDTLRDHEMKVADLRKKNLENSNKESLNYVEERTYYNDWKNHGDSPEEAYRRIKERNDKALQDGDITAAEYNDSMTEAGQKLYEGRLENSKKWLEMQKKYGAITDEEYRAGLKRVKEYTEQYYKQGIISGKYYYEALDDANSGLFDNMSETLEKYVNEYYNAQKEMLSARKAEIEAEYDALESAEKKADRAAELKDLQAQYAKYQNAVTIEGKKKLQEIQDNIDSLKKEERDEAREAEKQSRLDEIDKESDRLEKEQEESLNGISKYTAQALGIISGGNDEMIAKFNKVVENYNNQQAQLAQQGYDTVSKIVDMTNIKLAEIGQNIPVQSTGGGEVNVTITQSFNNNISDEVSATAYGKYAGASIRNIDWQNFIAGMGGFK